jgi:hypothetical protein
MAAVGDDLVVDDGQGGPKVLEAALDRRAVGLHQSQARRDAGLALVYQREIARDVAIGMSDMRSRVTKITPASASES